MSTSGRVFDEVLSVDAWRTSFDASSGLANVHVDVSFLRGKIGDDPQSPVRFEIAIKRAEIVFVIPANEPLLIIQSSVLREQPASVVTESSTNKDFKGQGKLAANVNLASGVAASASGSLESSTTESEKVSAKSDGGPVSWAQSKSAEGHYRWELAPKVAKVLLGKAWNPVSQPLLSIRRTSDGNIEPVCRVIVRCRREDLEIAAIEEKAPDRSLRGLLSDRSLNKSRAAEAYIRNCLSSRQLDIRNFDDPYGEITLADTFVNVGE